MGLASGRECRPNSKFKIESKLLGSKSTIHPCNPTWLEHLKKVSKSTRERIYNAHLCPYLVWVSQNRRQIAREQINSTPLWSHMTWASKKKSKSLRERIYETHLCPYLVWISQNREQIAREQINYTPLWSYMTWASQKVSKSTREPIYYTHLCPYLVSISQNMKQIY